MKAEERYIRRRLFASSVSMVVSTGLVLFMLGLVGLLLLTSHKLSVVVRERIGLSVYLSDDAREADMLRTQKMLESAVYAKSATLITKEEAAEILQKELDPKEDFITFLGGYNPVPASIDVLLRAQYANPDSITAIEKELRAMSFVEDVVYPKSVVHLVNENMRKITLFILGFSGLLFLIAIALINNTIRLSIYSRRFLIRTMQLVGATRAFIRRPFLLKSITNGIIAALFALGLLTGVIYALRQEVPGLVQFQEEFLLASLFGVVIVLGILISWLSTLFAVKKYLRIRTDELYY